MVGSIAGFREASANEATASPSDAAAPARRRRFRSPTATAARHSGAAQRRPLPLRGSVVALLLLLCSAPRTACGSRDTWPYQLASGSSSRGRGQIGWGSGSGGGSGGSGGGGGARAGSEGSGGFEPWDGGEQQRAGRQLQAEFACAGTTCRNAAGAPYCCAKTETCWADECCTPARQCTVIGSGEKVCCALGYVCGPSGGCRPAPRPDPPAAPRPAPFSQSLPPAPMAPAGAPAPPLRSCGSDGSGLLLPDSVCCPPTGVCGSPGSEVCCQGNTPDCDSQTLQCCTKGGVMLVPEGGCCPPGQRYARLTGCCKPEKVCGDVCCDDSSECDAKTKTCCPLGGVITVPPYGCCPRNRMCRNTAIGNVCCPAGYSCYNDGMGHNGCVDDNTFGKVAACPVDRKCGSLVSPTCCASGQGCAISKAAAGPLAPLPSGTCCPLAAIGCGGTVCCANPSKPVCVGGQCYASGTTECPAKSGQPCNPGYSCLPPSPGAQPSICCGPTEGVCGQGCCDLTKVCIFGKCYVNGTTQCPVGTACPPGNNCLQGKYCCPPNAFVCGGSCCTGVCIGGKCQPTGSVACPDNSTKACSPPNTCLANTACCASTEALCGTGCCAKDKACIAGQCLAKGTKECPLGSGKPCAADHQCANNAVCCAANEIACGTGCCSTATGTCLDNQCRPKGTSTCSGAPGNICAPNTVCSYGLCCKQGEVSCGSPAKCCPQAQCSAGLCCAAGQTACGGRCCSSNLCFNGVCAPVGAVSCPLAPSRYCDPSGRCTGKVSPACCRAGQVGC